VETVFGLSLLYWIKNWQRHNVKILKF